jgi:hypothetical protein
MRAKKSDERRKRACLQEGTKEETLAEYGREEGKMA